MIVVELNAKSSKEAIMLGRKAAQEIVFAKHIYAKKPVSGTQYGCDYGPENESRVSVIIPN